jgi:hypothetical protein
MFFTGCIHITATIVRSKLSGVNLAKLSGFKIIPMVPIA